MRAQSTRVLVLLCPGEGAKSEQRGKEQVSSWLPHKLSRKDRSVNKKDMHHFRGLHKAPYLIILHPQAPRNAPIDSKFKTKVELMRHTFFLLKVVLFLLFCILYMNNQRIINISWRVRLQKEIGNPRAQYYLRLEPRVPQYSPNFKRTKALDNFISFERSWNSGVEKNTT